MPTRYRVDMPTSMCVDLCADRTDSCVYCRVPMQLIVAPPVGERRLLEISEVQQGRHVHRHAHTHACTNMYLDMCIDEHMDIRANL